MHFELGDRGGSHFVGPHKIRLHYSLDLLQAVTGDCSFEMRLQILVTLDPDASLRLALDDADLLPVIVQHHGPRVGVDTLTHGSRPNEARLIHAADVVRPPPLSASCDPARGLALLALHLELP